MNLREFFNTQLNIKEAHELPDRLMSVLMNADERIKLFDAFFTAGLDTNVDTFNNYFQSEHSDRNSFMQDFTPETLTSVVKSIIGKQNKVADICAGVGGLSNQLEYETIYLEELSKRAIPLLLFILAVKNKKAVVWNGDSLTREVNAIYQLNPTDKYSSIELTDTIPLQFDAVVSNPPYSMKWDSTALQDDDRFVWFKTAPKTKADYAFVLHGLSKLKDDGIMAVVLPHGVLFRGNAEGEIRQQLLEENLIDTIISMPGNMFYNTQIPTCILVIKKNRINKDVLFIDASNEFVKEGKYNYLNQEQIDKITSVYQHRMSVDKFSYVATFDEIKENEFNLNVPRYVDTTEHVPPPDLIETLKELIVIEEEIRQSEKKLFEMFNDIDGTTDAEKERMVQVKELTRRLM